MTSDVVTSAPAGVAVAALDCRQLPLARDSRDLDVDRIAAINADIVFIHNFDHLIRIGRGRGWMRQLRAPVQLLVQGGTAVIVASRVPQRAFPAVDGSSIATDCYQYIMPETTLEDIAENHAPVRAVMQYSSTFVGVASRLVASIEDGLTSKELRRAAQRITKELLSATVRDCGADVLGWLEETFLNKRAERIAVEDVNLHTVMALTGAGIGALDAASDSIVLFPHIERAVAVAALRQAELDMYDAPYAWTLVATSIFSFERLCRRALTEHLAVHTHLVAQTLSMHSSKILSNYRYATGLRVADVADIANPWRWIDLSDVIPTCGELAVGASVVGIRERVWRRMGEDVVPIRNRIQHMRLPLPGDSDTVRSYIRMLKLGMTLPDRR